MNGLSSGFNLLPGVHEWDLPGNRPQDVAAERSVERYRDGLDDDDLLEFIENEDFDAAGCVLYRSDEHPDVWLLESEEPPWLPTWPRVMGKTASEDEYAKLIFTSKDMALNYALTFHDDETIEAMCERFIESGGEE